MFGRGVHFSAHRKVNFLFEETMNSADQLHSQLVAGASFFGGELQNLHPNFLAAASAPGDATPPPPIDKTDGGLFSAVQLTKEVAAEVQADMTKASTCMLNLT